MTTLPDLVRRQFATQATLNKYRTKRFDWKSGATCVHMARFHLRQMGHTLPEIPRIRSLLSAKRAMAANGWADVATMLDAQRSLERIAPAFMRVGDLAVLPGEGMDGIVICAGTHKLLGWHQDYDGMVEMEASLDFALGAWRA